jgi:hypothetical protein
MSTLTRSNPHGTTRDKTVPSFARPVAFGPSRRLRLKDAPPTRDAKNSAERVWSADLTKFEAEDLLDWLEAHGRQGQVTFVAGKGFTVH